MAITVEARSDIISIVVGMFNAAPGATILSQLTNASEAGSSRLQIATNLANTAEYLSIYPAFQTNGEFATKLVDNMLGSLVSAAGKAEAVTILTARLNAANTSTPAAKAAARAEVSLYALDLLKAVPTTDATFGAARTALDNKVNVATFYSVDSQLSPASVLKAQEVLIGVTNTEASVTAAKAAIGGQVNVGQTFTLTSGVDLISGGAGNDTIIADNTGGTKTLTVADQVVGGAGSDTLKIYLAVGDTATGQPTITDIEEVYINGGAITAYTAPAGSTKLSIDGATAAATTYTVGTKALSLANKTAAVLSTTTVATTGATHTTTVNAINTGAAVMTLDYSAASLTTLNLESVGTSSFALTNTGAGLTALNFSGTSGLTISAAPAAIVTVNASTATGALNYTAGTAAATFKFTGGAGNDTVAFANDGLAALTSGAQLNGGAGVADKIAISDTALSAAEAGKINAAVGFEVLGLNGAGLVLDASTLTSIKNFSIDTTGLTQTINNLATGSTTTITAGAPTSLTLGAAVGVTDTAIVLGASAASGAITVGTLVTTGITNVTITANGTGLKTITNLTNSDNSNFVIKGAAPLTMSLAAGTGVGSKIDGSAATGVLTLTGSAVIGSGDIIIGGSGADVLNGGRGADTLTGGAGADTFSFTSAAAANASGLAFGQADVITDFVVGVDKLQFSTADVVSGQQGAVQTAVTALAAGATDTQIATAMATASTTDLGVSFAVFGGNTYVLYETTGASTGVAADDVFIKLTGVTTLPTFATDVVA